jgi:hypothetical protein
MNAVINPATSAAEPDFELRFSSLFDPGRALAFPCDRAGHVDIDHLGPRARSMYLYARAMVGREYACPLVQLH